MNNNEIYTRMQKYLGDDMTASTEEIWNDELERVDVILFGYGRMWYHLAAKFTSDQVSHVVIDHNPELVQELEERPGEYIFADASNSEVYKHLFHHELKMVITTTRDLEDDLLIISEVQTYNPDIIIVAVSNHVQQALTLYEAWADYVIMPEALWAKHATALVEEIWFDSEKFIQEKVQHVKELRG